jgi:hypothetical protein
MRRALSIMLFLGVLACGLLVYLHRGRPAESREAHIAEVLSPVPLPPPRLAPASPSPDAERPRLDAAIATQDVGDDAGRPLLDEQSLMQQLRGPR